MLTLSDMSTCGGLMFQYDSTIKLCLHVDDCCFSMIAL
jgi:hypothetical protein